ncbi:energy-coupling factor ABC transporter ATP-binding protein [Corynebacterium choanae]|uniref:Biotin transport ATP-binding protein BioM n=1 Tax=Corynebacterium choanae TaxID=1862358 RepID=A0A3G6JA58_9CORY|nr:ABC transporter ATP-binding protein [Corynebacterium choanae]AZA13788.1 Biotin transport ATP-binding protein BioM [Corynebacterium choanae]
MSHIVFRDVHLSYDNRQVLSGISLDLAEQRIGIIGANGGGKSSLIRLINGLNTATEGTVTVDGINPATQGREVRRKVGFIFSDAENQIVMPTVREDIAFSLRRFRLGKQETAAKVHATMERFGLSGHANHSPHLLSGGQKQLLALASVLVLEPAVVIADEPTTLLDLANRLHIQQVFASLSQQLIVVTHDLDFLDGFDRVICIDQGAVAADGHPDEVRKFYIRTMMGAS